MTQFASSAAPTRYIDAAGVRYAYRRFGNERAGGCCVFSTSPARWTTGIRRSSTCWPAIAKSSCSTTPASAAPAGRFRRRSRTWRSMCCTSSMHCRSTGCISSDFARRLSRAGHRDRPTGTGRAVDPVRHRAGRRRRRGMDRPELLAIYTDGEMPMSEKLERLFSRQRPRARRPPPHSSTASPRALPARSAGRPRSRIRPAAGDDRVGELER